MSVLLPLDAVPTATCYGAYAAFRVSTAYTGATVTIRRSGDSVTTNFYADPYGNFGTTINGTGTSLLSWLGASTGYIVTWYDQSGRGNHATQTNTAAQPFIDPINNRIDFTSGSSYFNLPNGTVPNNVAYTVTVKHNNIGYGGTWLSSGVSQGVNQMNIFSKNGSYNINNNYINFWYANDFIGNDNVYNIGNVVTYTYDGSYMYLYINGTPQGVSTIKSNWNGQAINEHIGRNSYPGGYLNGELYYLYIFKSYLSVNQRTIIERSMSAPSTTGPIKFSQLKALTNASSSTSYSISQASAYAGLSSSTPVNIGSFDGYALQNGLFMRIYWSRYHNDTPAFFNNNTPNITGVTTNLRNTYCFTGGFNNPNAVDTVIGNVGQNTVYSVECTGFFYAPVGGTYTFYLLSDDNSYLWIGATATSGYTTSNTLLSGAGERSATLSLTGGTYNPFRLQYGDGGGGEYIMFTFAPPSGIRVYEGTGYYFCQTSQGPINMVSNSNLTLYHPFESVDMIGTTIANRAVVPVSYPTILYNGATVSTADYAVNSSSLSLTATSSQYALCPNFIPTTNGLTFSVWYRSNGSQSWARVFDFGNGAGSDNVFISCMGDGLNKLAISVFIGSTENKIYFTDINYNDNVWRHIVWTLSYVPTGSYTSTWNLYINGINKYSAATNLYPSTTITRTACYIGKSNWSDGYYNGYIDDFRIYNRVLTAAEAASLYANSNYNYIIKNGSTPIITQIQGTTPANPATSGYAIYAANPWLPNGYYWIKSAAMPNALRMFVNVEHGGYDFYNITGGTSVNYVTQTHSGTALGLELVIPRSQAHWRAIYAYVYTTLGSNYATWYPFVPIYRTTTNGEGSVGGNYTGYAMFDPRYGNSGSTTSSYNGVPDWMCKDGGLWYLRDIPYGEPNGDYNANALLSLYDIGLTSYGAGVFNDGGAAIYTGTTYFVSTNYAGSTMSTLYTYFDGSTVERAAPSALYIKNMIAATANGVYWINLPEIGPTQLYCIMDSAVDGGGWMMAMKATRGGTFIYTSSHWTTATTLNPTDTTRNDADAKFHSMNYFKSKDLLALWPDIPYNYAGGTGGSLSLSGYNNWCWMKNNYYSGNKQPLITYFSGIASNTSFGTPKGVERGTAFSSQAGNQFYGTNFTAAGGNEVRWGFGWNNENDWYSDDVSGGIGMNRVAYSAGDYIGCCQDQTGFNRSARVEMYIR
jgi:hypothetical protein